VFKGGNWRERGGVTDRDTTAGGCQGSRAFTGLRGVLVTRLPPNQGLFLPPNARERKLIKEPSVSEEKKGWGVGSTMVWEVEGHPAGPGTERGGGGDQAGFVGLAISVVSEWSSIFMKTIQVEDNGKGGMARCIL